MRRAQCIKRPARSRPDRQAILLACREPAPARVRDHRGVIRAEARARIAHLHTKFLPERGERLTQTLVRADAAGDDERAKASLIERALALRDERIDDSLLKLGGQVRAGRIVQFDFAARDDNRPTDGACSRTGHGDRPRQPAAGVIASADSAANGKQTYAESA